MVFAALLLALALSAIAPATAAAGEHTLELSAQAEADLDAWAASRGTTEEQALEELAARVELDLQQLGAQARAEAAAEISRTSLDNALKKLGDRRKAERRSPSR